MRLKEAYPLLGRVVPPAGENDVLVRVRVFTYSTTCALELYVEGSPSPYGLAYRQDNVPDLQPFLALGLIEFARP